MYWLLVYAKTPFCNNFFKANNHCENMGRKFFLFTQYTTQLTKFYINGDRNRLKYILLYPLSTDFTIDNEDNFKVNF